jgi:transposase
MLIPSLRRSREDGMGKSYSMDLRERVVAAIEGGVSTRQAAVRFQIGIATAGTWARLKRATGDVRPAKQGKPKGSVLDAHADFILGALAEAPDTGRAVAGGTRRHGCEDRRVEVSRPARSDA